MGFLFFSLLYILIITTVISILLGSTQQLFVSGLHTVRVNFINCKYISF